MNRLSGMMTDWPALLAKLGLATCLIGCVPTMNAQAPPRPSLLSSVNDPGQTAAGDSMQPVMSRDGTRLVFVSQAANLTFQVTDPRYWNLYAQSLPVGPLQLISINASQTAGGAGDSYNPVLSTNGQWLCFESDASDLTPGDTNQTTDIFLRDLETGINTLVSANDSQSGSGQGRSTQACISDDGCYVLFVSDAPDLVSGDTNDLVDLFLFDRESGQTHGLTLGGFSVPPARPYTLGHSMSADARSIAFAQRGVSHHPAATNASLGEVYLVDCQENTTDWISAGAADFFPEVPADLLGSKDPVISPNGRLVVFKAFTNHFNLPFPEAAIRLLVYDRDTQTTELVSEDVAWEALPHWSADSQSFAYATKSSVYLWDAANRQSTLVSVNAQGQAPAIGTSSHPSLSADGRVVTFVSTADLLGDSTTTGPSQLYRHDLVEGTTVLLSTEDDGGGRSHSHAGVMASLNHDGSRIAFDSTNPNLVGDDKNHSSDVFLYESDSDHRKLVSRALSGAAPATDIVPKFMPPGRIVSRDGRRVVFLSPDSPHRPQDTNGLLNVFVRDLWDQTITPAGAWSSNTFAPGLMTAYPELSGDGRHLFYGKLSPPFEAVLTQAMEVWHDDLVAGTSRFVRQVTWPSSAVRASWTPLRWLSSNEDGTQLLYVDGHQVWQENVRTGKRDLVDFTTPTNGIASHPGFLPQGNGALFISDWQLVYFDATSMTNAYLSEIPLHGLPRYPFWRVHSYGYAPNGRFLVLSGEDYFSEEIISYIDLAAWTNHIVCTNCHSPSISGNGQQVAFAYDPPEDSSGNLQLWVRDIPAGTTKLISANRFGTDGAPAWHQDPVMTYDGRYVAFTSPASDLVENDGNEMRDLFVRDLALDQTFLITWNLDGNNSANGSSHNPVLGSDGRTILFESFASDLVPGDYNAHQDIFMVRLGSEDSDGDLMDDDFEYAYFGTLDRDGAGDWDGDGHTDYQEFQTGTSPADGSSILRVLTLSRLDTGQTRLMWSAVPGKLYRVQSRTGAEGDGWEDVSDTVQTTGSTGLWTATQGDPQERGPVYYRVMALP